MMIYRPVMTFRIKPPTEKPAYLATIAEDDSGALSVFTTRSGAWAPEGEHGFEIADLICPQYRKNDWDVDLLPEPVLDLPAQGGEGHRVVKKPDEPKW